MLLNYGYAQDKKSDSLSVSPSIWPIERVYPENTLGYAYMRMGSESNYMEYRDSTVIRINGDTITILRMLLYNARKAGDREAEAWGKVGYYMRQCKELIRINDQILKLDGQITKERINKVKQMQATIDNSIRQTKELRDGIDKMKNKLNQ